MISVESFIVMVVFGVNMDDFFINVFGVIGVDVVGVIVVVGNFRRSGYFLLGVVVDLWYVE